MPDLKPMFWRLLTISGSVLLTLVLFIGLALFIGLSIADRELAKVGIKDWSISIESLSREQLIINSLNVTMNELPSSLNSDATAPPLSIRERLSTPIPSWLPETIILKNVNLNGELFEPYAPLQGKVKLNTKRSEVNLHLLRPEPFTVNLSRSNSVLSVAIEHNLARLNANYELPTGEWNIDGLANVPEALYAQASEFVKSERIALLLNAEGSLPPETETTGAEGLINALSGTLTVSLQEPVNVASSGVASVTEGNIGFSFKSGVIENYDLRLSGDLTQWPALPLKLNTVQWQLSSEDTLALEPLNYRHILNKTNWPVQFSAMFEGDDVADAQLSTVGQLILNDTQFARLELPKTRLSANEVKLSGIEAMSAVKLNSLSQLALSADLTIERDQVIIRSQQPSSVFANSRYANADLSVSKLLATIPYDTPSAASARLSTEMSNVIIKMADFKSLKPHLSHNIHYRDGRIDAEGTITLAKGATLNHHSALTAELDLNSNIDISLDNLAQADVQSQLLPLLQDRLPLLTLNKGSAMADFKLSGNLKTGQWNAEEGVANLKAIDGIYDTTSVTDANFNTTFNATTERLHLQTADLSIASIQQGFVIGPIKADFAARVPFKEPQSTTVTLHSHSINALGGTVRIPEQTYDFAEQVRMPVVFERINLGELMRQYPSNRIEIDGDVSGTIPLVWDSQQLTVEKGYLSAVAPGGHLQVDSSALRSAVGTNPSLKTLASVLDDFYYQELSSVVGYDKNGELTLELQLGGYNPAVENGRKVKLNVTLEEDLPALIKGIQLSNSVSDVIRKRIQQRVN